jgi:hypothetical protein
MAALMTLGRVKIEVEEGTGRGSNSETVLHMAFSESFKAE